MKQRSVSPTGPSRWRLVRTALVAGICAGLTALSVAPASASVTPASDPAPATSSMPAPVTAVADDTEVTPAQAQVLTWTAGDSMTEYASVTTTATAGAATIVFENSEATGNTTGLSHTLTFDTSSPDYNSDVDLNLIASPFDANGGKHEAEVTLTPGKYRFFCSIPGHSQMTGVLTVTEGGGGEPGDDTTAPTVSAEVTGEQDADGNYVGTANVAVTAEDDASGVDTVEYEIDDTGFKPYTEPVAVSDVGDHTVQFRATDKAGNASEPGSKAFTVVAGDPADDTTAPEVTAEVAGEQDADGNYLDAANVTVSATDVGSGVETVEYNLDGAGFTAYSEPVAVTEPGEHTVTYRATDKAGNVSEEGSSTFTVVKGPDTTAPVVSAMVAGKQDAQWDYIDSARITLTATDDDSGLRFMRYSLDGGSYTAYGEQLVITEPGEHTVLYHATDQAGNRSEDGSLTFTITTSEAAVQRADFGTRMGYRAV
jgi:plastocyanin